MTADQKENALNDILARMEEADSLSELESLYDEGYEYAKGSNSRKDKLKEVFNEEVSRFRK